jgi:hypothetical protein
VIKVFFAMAEEESSRSSGESERDWPNEQAKMGRKRGEAQEEDCKINQKYS